MTFFFDLVVNRIRLHVLRLSDGTPYRTRLQAPEYGLPAGLQMLGDSKMEICGTHVWVLMKPPDCEGYQVLIWDWTTGELIFVTPFHSRPLSSSLMASTQYQYIEGYV